MDLPAHSPKIRLSRLRDIGWSIWDPLGLLPEGRHWNDEECRSFADEYDSYLLHAAGQLRRGVPEAEVANYLVSMEADRMGLGETDGSHQRARSLVAAITGDHQLWNGAEE